jgi:hypothetical protein
MHGGAKIVRPTLRRALVGAAIGLVLVVGLGLPQPSVGFPVDRCALTITSLDGDGSPLGTAESGARDATQSQPLVISWSGSITWTGSTGDAAFRRTSWHIEVFGVPTPLRGGDANEEGETTGTDSIRLADVIPFRVAGLFHVTGGLEGEGGTCRGEGWVQIAGDPVGTVPFLVSLAMWLVGAALLAVGARGHWLTAVGGGVLVGLGSAVLLVLFSTLPFGALTPGVVMAAGVLLGLVAGWYGRILAGRTRRRG